MSERRPVFLDVMSTLVHDPFAREMPAFFGLTLEELIEQKHPTAWIEFELDRLDEAAFLRRFFRDGRDYDHEAFRRCVREAYRWIEGVEPVLRAMRDAGVEMHVLSNYPPWYRWIEERLQLSRYAAWTFVSCETGVRKPDPEAYLGAARSLGVAPEACLFVDDRERNCVAAREVGIDAVRFEDAGRLRAALEGRGLLGRGER